MTGRAGALPLLVCGCLSALHDPPAVTPKTDALNPDAKAKLFSEAESSYARRPDLQSVQRAEQIYREIAQAGDGDAEGYGAAIRVIGWMVEHSTDSGRREALSVGAVDLAQACERVSPQSAQCDYGLALAVGMQARERPTTANDALKRMVDLLGRLAHSDPGIDDAGPHRVLALVMLRAPGWPTGPGDAEQGLVEARAAVALRGDFPPNLLVLAEALKANGKAEDSKKIYTDVLDLARKKSAAGDPDAADWIRDAEKALR